MGHLIEAIQPLMRTERIRLVPPSMDLLQDSLRAIQESKKELSEYLGWVDASLEAPEANMQLAIKNHNDFKDEVRFYILDTRDSNLLGAIGLIVRDVGVPFYELGYWIRNTQIGNGYATEAVGVLEAHAFQKLSAKRVEIRTAKGNLKSRAVAEKCGYMKEAELINERCLPSGEVTDTVIYVKYQFI